MSRYIDKSELLEWLERVDGCIADGTVEAPTLYKQMITDINNFAASDAVEVRHGEWVKQKPNAEAMQNFYDMGLGKGMGLNSIYWVCSECENWGTPTHRYCCSCGAKMDGERSKNERDFI